MFDQKMAVYAAMIDTSRMQDSSKSIHVTRFTERAKAVWHQHDLEAAAWNVVEQCLKVHEQGWNRAETYHMDVKRGSKADVGPYLEARLEVVCSISEGVQA